MDTYVSLDALDGLDTIKWIHIALSLTQPIIFRWRFCLPQPMPYTRPLNLVPSRSPQFGLVGGLPTYMGDC